MYAHSYLGAVKKLRSSFERMPEMDSTDARMRNRKYLEA